jgi:hypothetical protein
MADLYPFQQQLLNGIKAGEIKIISAGRNVGKSYVNTIMQDWYRITQLGFRPKIKWQRLPGLKLQAYTDEVGPRGFERGLREDDMDPVQAWSDECHCGTRMSFNVWKFKSEKQITMFLIRWAE